MGTAESLARRRFTVVTAAPPKPKEFAIKGVRYRKPPPPWIAYSIGAHVVLIFALGFIRVFGGGGLEWLGERGPPPSHRVELRGPEKPRIDLDARAGAEGTLASDPWPGAPLSDHDESDDAEDFARHKGDLFWLFGKPEAEVGHGGKAAGIGVASAGIGVGVGGGPPRPGRGAGRGGGVRRGGPQGGKHLLVLRGGGSDATERAVAAGLRWLARHQKPGGSWSAAISGGCSGPPCTEGCSDLDSHEAGLTGLALLAFLDAGFTPRSPERFLDEVSGRMPLVGDIVVRGLLWLQAHMDANGSFRSQGGNSYDDAIATFALAEACTRCDSAWLRGIAARAVDFIVSTQHARAGWRYEVAKGDTDTSVTAWCALALRAARNAGFSVPDSAFDGARTFVLAATDREGRVGYLSAGDATGDQSAFGFVGKGEPRFGNTPAGLVCRMLAGGRVRDESFDRGEQLILAHLPSWPRGDRVKTNFTYWYYGTLELFHADGPSGERWRRWNAAMVEALVERQRTEWRGDACAAGSWDAEGDWWASREGGRVLATALNTLTLEVYYRYAPLMESR